jgi:hypothetical protein
MALVLSIVLGGFSPVGSFAQPRTAAVFCVFKISYKEKAGSAFAIHLDGRQYVVTAKHLVPEIKDGDSIRLLIDRAWKTFTVKPIFCDSPGVDIVVLVLSELIALPDASYRVVPSADGVFLGGDLFFLGFPYQFVTFQEGWPPLPFEKRAILSAIDFSDKSRVIFYLDGHNNPGFSGGPVYFWDAAKGQSRFVAVVSAFRGEYMEVLAPKKGETRRIAQIPPEELEKTGKFVPINTGIIVAYDIKHAVDAIQKRPIGVPIPSKP